MMFFCTFATNLKCHNDLKTSAFAKKTFSALGDGKGMPVSPGFSGLEVR